MSAITYQTRHSERLLWICVAGSILLHALVMWQMHGVEPEVAPVQSLRATIRLEPRPAAPPPPPAAAPEPKLREPPKPAAPPEPPKAIAKPVIPDKPAAKEPLAEAKPAPTPQPAPQPAPTASATPAAPTAAPAETKNDANPDASKSASASTAASPRPSDADDRILIRGFQTGLAQAAEKTKRYPGDAMVQGWQGTARVRLHIGADTKTAGIEILSSAGHDILDEQARVAIEKAKTRVFFPPGLRGKEFSVDIDIVFTLAKKEE